MYKCRSKGTDLHVPLGILSSGLRHTLHVSHRPEPDTEIEPSVGSQDSTSSLTLSADTQGGSVSEESSKSFDIVRNTQYVGVYGLEAQSCFI